MNPTETPDRCRLVLIAPQGVSSPAILDALQGGDVASLILPQWDMDDDAFQRHAEAVIPQAQAAGVAVMIAGDVRIAMRARADGVHTEAKRPELEEIAEKYQGKLMLGAGGADSRDAALNLGEVQPDYIFVGRFGYDSKPEPHPRNLKLGEWWAQMVQIPCIVLGGADIASVEAVAATGADFVALGAAVFADGIEPAAAVAQANALLDAEAPTLES